MNLTGDSINHYSNYSEEIKKNYNKYFNEFTTLIVHISIIIGAYLDCQLSTLFIRNEKKSKFYYYTYWFTKQNLSLPLILKSTT
jgi:hypothetical protein